MPVTTAFKEVLDTEIPIKTNNKDSSRLKTKNSEKASKKPKLRLDQFRTGRKIMMKM